MTEANMRRRLAYHLGWWKNLVLNNVYINDYEMDLCTITNSGYLIEYEIKCTFADFCNDLDKPKWGKLRCTEFYYVVPVSIAHKVEAEAPVQCGVISVNDAGYVSKLRRAKRLDNPKLTPEEQIYLLSKMIPKYWRTVQPRSEELIQWYESAHSCAHGGCI